MDLIWNLKGSLPRKIADGIKKQKEITIGGLSLAESPILDSKMVIVMLREEKEPFGRFTTGWIPPYSIQNIKEGLILNSIRLDPRLPADNESIYEATIISLD